MQKWLKLHSRELGLRFIATSRNGLTIRMTLLVAHPQWLPPGSPIRRIGPGQQHRREVANGCLKFHITTDMSSGSPSADVSSKSSLPIRPV
jgi:hypothetical protein